MTCSIESVAACCHSFFLITFWIPPIEAGTGLQVRMACGRCGSSQLLHAEVLRGLWKIFDTWMTWHYLHKNCAALSFANFLVDPSLCECSVCHRMCQYLWVMMPYKSMISFIITLTLQLQHCWAVQSWMAFTFQEFAIAWSQPPNGRDVLPPGGPLGAWHGHCHGSHPAVLPGGSDEINFDVMLSFLSKLLGRPVEHIFFVVSMAAWLDDLCQWWGGGQGLKGIITWGICLKEMLAQWTDDPMWFWNPAYLSQVGPGSWLRMVRDKNRREEAQVFLGLWKWNCSSLYLWVNESTCHMATCLQFPHLHRNEKWHHLHGHGLWDHFERTFVMCSGYTWQDPTRRDMRRGRYLNWTRAEIYSSSHGVIQGLAQGKTCWKLFGSVNLSLKSRGTILVPETIPSCRTNNNIDAHIAETEVERLLRKMLLKLICTTLPITLNPSMQFLVWILLSWRAGRIKIKRHVYPQKMWIPC